MSTIINYGTGNYSALGNILKNLKIDFQISSDYESIKNSEKYILPGVGSFDAAMTRLKSSKLIDSIEKLVFKENIPILGVCVGLQIMARKSEEGEIKGLGWNQLITSETSRLEMGLKRKPYLLV